MCLIIIFIYIHHLDNDLLYLGILTGIELQGQIILLQTMDSHEILKTRNNFQIYSFLGSHS